jgi:RimJ/RimL family protein N-acetyltransferase/NTP pyrophosphatase (non-canonical NTP hydrolase)
MQWMCGAWGHVTRWARSCPFASGCTALYTPRPGALASTAARVRLVPGHALSLSLAHARPPATVPIPIPFSSIEPFTMTSPTSTGAPLLDLRALEAALQQFADDRQWQAFHSPKNLAMALTGEVGELVELFQWQTEADSHAVARHPQTARAVRDELADVLLYLVRMASVLGVDLNEAVVHKMAANARKYPTNPAIPADCAMRQGTRIAAATGTDEPVFNLPAQPLQGHGVRLEPYEDALKEEVRQALDCDAPGWQLFAMSGQGGHFEAWWSLLMAHAATGLWIPYAIRDLATGQVVGTSSFLNINPPRRCVEIGATFLHPGVRSGHVNPAAKRLMLAWAFDAGVRRVELLTDARNLRSQAAIAKLGAVREGVLRRERVTWTGHVRDSVLFSITDLDWPGVRERLALRTGH